MDFSFYLFFVFSLRERKNEKQQEEKYRSAARTERVEGKAKHLPRKPCQ